MLEFVEFLSSDSETEFEETIKGNAIAVEQNQQRDANANYHSAKKNVEKKKEVLALIHQLHTHIITLEKEKKSQLYNKVSTKNDDFKDLQIIENNHQSDRKNEEHLIKENLEKISSKIYRFQREKTQLRKHASSLEKLKMLMEDIEIQIMQFKEQQKLVYEDLAINEKNLTAEINDFDKKFQQWSKISTAAKKTSRKIEAKNKDVDSPREVLEFEKYLQLTGGHQGGWDDIDHQTFLKLSKQIKNSNHLLTAAIRDIPTQTHEDIIQHMEWYSEYTHLKEKKRVAIRKWKNSKLSEKGELLAHALQHDQDMIDIKRQKREEMLEREKQERFEKLQDWRGEKEALKQNIEREQKEEKKQQEKIKQAIEERKRFELKLQVDAYKKKKKEEDEILKLAKEDKITKEKITLTSAEIERIKERNEKIALSKRNQQLTKLYEKEEKEHRLENIKKTVAVKVERDPSRLFKMTEGWKHRKESHDRDNTKASVVTGARMMPHRAVPSWRKGP